MCGDSFGQALEAVPPLQSRNEPSLRVLLRDLQKDMSQSLIAPICDPESS